MQFAVWVVWILIVGGYFAAVFGEEVKGRIGSYMSDLGTIAFVVGLFLAVVAMTYLANAQPIR
ncbi:MAG: hypothetical protein NUV80_05865 [Candidatus Berkelbacteria bacterium]|nr:hypothetical protein [Candidatus Berkelbacteria bacterium]MCR4308060.1 hypothetical protein [Candidatus Berkelbacteria bacterium]